MAPCHRRTCTSWRARSPPGCTSSRMCSTRQRRTPPRWCAALVPCWGSALRLHASPSGDMQGLLARPQASHAGLVHHSIMRAFSQLDALLTNRLFVCSCAQADEEAPGPSLELDFWAGRAADLASLAAQLASDKIAHVVSALKAAGSTYAPALYRCAPAKACRFLRRSRDLLSCCPSSGGASSNLVELASAACTLRGWGGDRADA